MPRFVLLFVVAMLSLCCWAQAQSARDAARPPTSSATAADTSALAIPEAIPDGITLTLTEAPQYVGRESAVTLDLEVPTKTAAGGDRAR